MSASRNTKGRQIGFRIAAGAAVIGVLLSFGSSTADATASGPDASASIQCDPLDPGPYNTANWHVHIANNGPANPNGVLFGLFSESDAESHYLLPGQSLDVVVTGRDGLGTTLTVAADGSPILNKTAQTTCNPVTTNITFNCPSNASPYLLYSMGNPSPSTYNFHADEGNGLDVLKQLTASSGTVQQALFKGEHFHGKITLNGATLKELEADANCEVEIPTTTTTTIKPTTTTTTINPTTTTTIAPLTPTTIAEVHAPGTTPTTVVVSGVDPDPTTSTTIAGHHATVTPAAAATTTTRPAATTLPFTGSTSVPLGALGFGLLIVGGATMLVLRRDRAEI